MKFLVFLTIFICPLLSTSQVKIHAHNDYEKPAPLSNALENKVWSVEADVFLRDGKLLVAHNAADISEERSLDALYLQPIISRFKKYKGHLSADKKYQAVLMIDVKEGGHDAIDLLARKLAAHRNCFDRNKNPNAVQVVISGDRGSIQSWNSYPSFIYFDGRPAENYDSKTLPRVALISDSYSSYASKPEKIESVLEKSHKMGKPFRFWGTPDDEKHWKLFHDAGVDIINTDKPESCRKFFADNKA